MYIEINIMEIRKRSGGVSSACISEWWGTGGHIYPALALIREIKVKSRSKIFIYWYGKWTREYNRSKSRYTISIYCYKWI